jgi:hypothetical protein
MCGTAEAYRSDPAASAPCGACPVRQPCQARTDRMTAAVWTDGISISHPVSGDRAVGQREVGK